MKKLFIIVALAFYALSLKAQITLEHSFTTAVSSFKTDNGVMFYTDNGLSKSKDTTPSIKIYNSDYSIYKTTNLTLHKAYNSFICNVYKNVFTSSNKVEILYVCYDGFDTYNMVLYNEDGDSLYNFGDYNMANIVVVDNTLKLLATKKDEGSFSGYPKLKSAIFTLGGNVSSLKSQVIKQSTGVVYPNPTSTTVNLPYQLNVGQTATMTIYNSNGQFIDQKQIDSNFNVILLNVAGYIPGIYFYEYNGISSNFIVN